MVQEHGRCRAEVGETYSLTKEANTGNLREESGRAWLMSGRVARRKRTATTVDTGDEL